MLTIDLHEELKELSRVRKYRDDKYLRDSPQGIEYLKHANSKVEMLKHFGTASVVFDVDQRLKKLVEMKDKFGEQYSNLYTTADIKRLCHKYYLRFLPSILFKGNIDEIVLEKMQAFEDSQFFKEKIKFGCFEIHKTTGVNQYVKNGNYFIVAPAASFKLSDKPKDPLLFCYAGDGLWYLVCKWGNDLSFTRRIIGLITYNIEFALLIGNILMLIGYGFGCNALFNLNFAGWVVVSFFGLSFWFFVTVWIMNSYGDHPRTTWNSEFK